MTTTAHDVQRGAILTACRNAAVATAAGVAFPAWASTTSPRVLAGDRAGYVAGLHRGRLPALEVFQAEDTWDRLTRSGGNILTTWVLRAHVPDLTLAAAESRARAVLLVALAVLRAGAYLDEGEEAFGPLRPGPFGHMLEVRVGLVHTYDRATYETDATITPGGGGMSGTTYLLAYSDVSPATIFLLPADQALDNIELHIVQAWNGVGASLKIGVAGDVARYFDSNEVELDTAGVTFEKDFDELGPQAIIATLVPGLGAGAGLVRIQISTTVKGT